MGDGGAGASAASAVSGASAPAGAQGSYTADALAAAHAELLRDRSLQFRLPIYTPPADPPWLRALLEKIGDFLNHGIRAAGPYIKIALWIGLALIVLLIGVFVVRDMMQVGKRWKRVTVADTPGWRPDLAKAMVLLEDADALADQGRFEAAAHLLLLRGVQDMQHRRPRAVRPALTSREIAASPELPAAAREAFAPIADAVERSFYGELRLDQTTWLGCRGAYERLIFPAAWAA